MVKHCRRSQLDAGYDGGHLCRRPDAKDTLPHGLTSTRSILWVMLVAIAALSACQLRPATSDSFQTPVGITATPTSDQETRAATLTATASSVARPAAEGAVDQTRQTTPIVVTVTPGTATTPTVTPGKIYLSTKKLAEAYLAALVAGDEEGVSSLLTAGAVCTPGNFGEVVERHLDRFSARQVRNIRIEVEAGSPTMHGRFSEVAYITFEYKKGVSSDWREVTIWIAAQFRGSTTQRGICDVSRIDVK